MPRRKEAAAEEHNKPQLIYLGAQAINVNGPLDSQGVREQILDERTRWLSEGIGTHFPIVSDIEIKRFTVLWPHRSGTLASAQAQSRVWNHARRLSQGDPNMQGLLLVPFDRLRSSLRNFESGAVLEGFEGVGPLSWDIFSALINLFVETPQGLILPWDTKIHPDIKRRHLPNWREHIDELAQRYATYNRPEIFGILAIERTVSKP